MFSEVRSFGMLFTADFLPVLLPQLSLGEQKLVGELDLLGCRSERHVMTSTNCEIVHVTG
jgi:hypothetical protein